MIRESAVWGGTVHKDVLVVLSSLSKVPGGAFAHPDGKEL